MNDVVLSKNYPAPPFCRKEIMRYAGCKEVNGEISSILNACIGEAQRELCYKVCYIELSVKTNGDVCDFGVFRLSSQKLSANLKGCTRAVLFAATVGVGIDRLIAKYGRISPTKALFFQAIGAERIEALCDTFCKDIAANTELNPRPRFSPGYGDLPLLAQRDIFSVLDCTRKIGLSLNDSLLMSPSKSVTAFIGLSECGTAQTKSGCSACDKQDCDFRGAL